MSLDFYVTAFVTLFVVIDPIGLTPIFVALTRGMSRQTRRAIAIRACVISFVILLLFGLLGESVLSFVGISMPAFRIAGGILLFLTALDMLFERRTERRQGQAGDPGDDPSVFPMAIPLLAGPGAIASMILLTEATSGDLAASAAIFGVMAAVLAMALVLFLMSSLIERLLDDTLINVITRLFGMLLAALSVQFVLTGLANSGFGG